MLSKHVLSILILNVAMICVFSIFSEINSVDSKIESLNYTMSNSIDNAVQLTTASEELIGNDWDSEVTSKVDKVNEGTEGNMSTNAKAYKGVQLNYFADGSWRKGNFFGVCHDFDRSDNTFNGSPFSFTDSEHIYNWLYKGTSRSGNPFSDYYNHIGKTIKTKVYSKNGGYADYSADTYTLGSDNVPLLDEMGIFNEDINNEENSVSFLSTGKQGKEALFSGTGSVEHWTPPSTTNSDGDVDKSDTSKYFVTPTSLGVTYLDPQVLKATIASNIETFVRCEKNDFDGSNKSVGMIPTQVWNGASHYTPVFNDNNTFNNGLVEFDMDSLDVNIEYNVIDRYSSANNDLLATVFGAEVGSTGTNGRASDLAGKDTSNADSKVSDYNKVVVAKVTVGIDINMPYSTQVMQYFRYLARTDNSDRLGIKPLQYSKGKKDSNVIRYTYTTYTAVAR